LKNRVGVERDVARISRVSSRRENAHACARCHRDAVGGGSGNSDWVTLNGSGNYIFSGTYNTAVGGLTIQMAPGGSQTLSGTSTYSKTTSVNSGTLLVNSPGSIASATTVNAKGTLGGSGTISNSVTVAANGYLAPGNGTNLGILTVTTNVFFNGGAYLTIAMSNALTAGTTYSQLVINGTNTVTGTNYVQLSALTGTITNGTYVLITNANYATKAINNGLFMFPGNTTNITIGGVTLTLTNSANSLLLAVPNNVTFTFTNLTWNGSVSSVWDTTTPNWFNAQIYADADPVTFDDSAVNYVVTGGTVNPYSVTFTNSVNNYTVGAAIGGATAVTKNGTATVTLTGANTYTGFTTNNGGILQVGNGAGSGVIPTNIVLNGGSLAYNLTNNYTQAGTIASTNSSVNITNLATLAGSTLELTMADGTKTFANIVNKSAGTLALNGSANSTNTVVNGLNSPANTTLRVDGGVWTNTPSLVMTASATLLVNGGTLNAIGGMRHYVGNLTISNGVMTVGGTSDRLGITDTSGQTFTMAGGTLNVNSTATYGFRMGGDSGATGTYNAFTGVQSGGTVNIYKGGNNTSFSVGGSTSSSVMDSYTLLGGTLNVIGGGTDGCLLISADVAGTGTTTFTLGGGKLIVSGSTPGYNQANLAGAQNTGTPNQVFNWTNGILVAGACTMTNLQSVAGGAYGTLTNGGGTLAPGDIGTPGKTIIIGNYGQGSGGTLAIDIGGTNQGNAFQNGATNYDFVSVSGNATLGGSLSVSLINSFVPAATNSFIILTNGGTLSMAFANLTAGNRVALAANPNASFLVVTTATKVILTNYLVAASTTTALNSSANPSVYGQSVTFTATVQTNGVAVGNATSSYVFYVNGTPVATNTVASGAATYTASTLTVGSYAIQAVYLGDANYAASTNSLTQTVNALPVLITGTRAYDGTTVATNTVLLITNGVNGDNVTNALTAGNATLAGATVGTQGIIATNNLTLSNSGRATNYTLVGASGAVVITQASANYTAGVSLVSSSPTNGYLSGVNFTSTVPAFVNSGSVIFLATNGGFGAVISTNGITNGIAYSLVVTNLPRGTNVITAQFAGDANVAGWTNAINQYVTNHPPTATTLTVTGTLGVQLAISLADLSTNWTDPDGDAVSLTNVNLTTTNGYNLYASNFTYQTNGTVVTIETNSWSYIVYTNGPLAADQISYSITDGQGGTNIGYINIVLDTNGVVGTNSIASYNFTNGVPFTLTAYGVVGQTYIAQRSTNLTDWVNIATNTAETNGVINVSDSFMDLGSNAPSPLFYRLKWQSP